MKLVYIAHPFSGLTANIDSAERIIRKLIPDNPGTVFFSPLHAFGFFYHDVPYEVGMEHCLEVLSRCDELWLCPGWEDSKGCCIENEFAGRRGMVVRLLVTDDNKCGGK